MGDAVFPQIHQPLLILSHFVDGGGRGVGVGVGVGAIVLAPNYPHHTSTLMHIFGLEIRRADRGKAREEAEGTEVRLARLEEEVRARRSEAQRLEGVASRVEAAELAREAGFLKAVEALRSVLGRIDARLGRKRSPDRGGSDDGNPEHDWLSAYRSLRGHAPGAAAARVEADREQLTEDGK